MKGLHHSGKVTGVTKVVSLLFAHASDKFSHVNNSRAPDKRKYLMIIRDNFC